MKEKQQSGYSEYANANGIVLRHNFIDEAARMNAVPLSFKDWDDEVVCYFYENGFEYHSAYINANAFKKKESSIDIGQRVNVAKAITMSLSVLNHHKKVEELFYYLDLLFSDVLDRDGYSIDRTAIKSLLFYVHEGNIEVKPSVGYYEFVKPNLTASQRISIINATRGLAQTEKNFNTVSLAVRDLISDEGTNLFITHRLISDVTTYYNWKEKGVCLSEDIVKRCLNEDLKFLIHRHNKAKCLTDNFKTYEKMCNINRIIEAVRSIKLIKDKIKKEEVAEVANVSRKTVYNLWNEKKIQVFLNTYNEQNKEVINSI